MAAALRIRFHLLTAASLVFFTALARARVVAMDGNATRFQRIGEELFVFFGGVGGVKCAVFHVGPCA